MEHYLPGDRVETPRGRGTVVMDRQSWDHDVCDAGWTHAAGGQPPRYITVLLDASPGDNALRQREVTFLPGEVSYLPQLASCDP